MAAIAPACAVQDGGEPELEALTVQMSEIPENAPLAVWSPPPAPARTAPTEAAPRLEASEPALEDLLRLPASVGEVDTVTGRWRWNPQAVEAAGKKAAPPRLQLELDTNEDPAASRPSTTRSRTDAGVAVDVGKLVRLRGGVRLEQESGQEPEDLVPTVGIEKRF